MPLSAQLSILKDQSLSLSENIRRILSNIQDMGIFMQKDAVLSYLIDHPDMLEMIYKACRSAKSKFPDAELSLEMEDDPDAPYEHPALFIRMNQYPAQIMDEIDAVRLPLYGSFPHVSGWLTITTDFDLPKMS